MVGVRTLVQRDRQPGPPRQAGRGGFGEGAGRADERGDVHGRERAAEEIEQLTRELSRALGVGGRDRKQGSSAEKARVNAQRRITDAIKKIGETCPKLSRHLADTVRTGNFCWYDPTSKKRPA